MLDGTLGTARAVTHVTKGAMLEEVLTSMCHPCGDSSAAIFRVWPEHLCDRKWCGAHQDYDMAEETVQNTKQKRGEDLYACD